MEIQTNEIEYCKLNVICSSSKEELDAKTTEVLDAFKRAPVPGNRKNKASLESIKFHYRNQISESVKRAMAEACFHETLFQKNVKPVVSPQFTSLNITDGSFKCEFTLYTKPNFDLGKYKGFEIPKPHIDETPEIIAAKMMQELRENAGTSEQFTSDDIVQLGDNIIIDYDCFDGDVMIKEACAQGDIILVGKTSLSEFDNNLIGMKLGEVREFNFSVPENAVSIIKGKVVRFVVTLNSASKTVPHALNDELAQKFASENIDDLTSKINMAASKRYEDSLLVKKIENITGILLDGSNIDVPSWLSLQEAQYLCSSNKGDWNSLTEANKQSLLDAGAKNVKLSLILEKIREEEPDCQLSDEEVVQIIKNNLSKADLKKSVEESLKDLNSGGYLQVLINRARDEHTMQFIINSSTIVE